MSNNFSWAVARGRTVMFSIVGLAVVAILAMVFTTGSGSSAPALDSHLGLRSPIVNVESGIVGKGECLVTVQKTLEGPVTVQKTLDEAGGSVMVGSLNEIEIIKVISSCLGAKDKKNPDPKVVTTVETIIIACTKAYDLSLAKCRDLGEDQLPPDPLPPVIPK